MEWQQELAPEAVSALIGAAQGAGEGPAASAAGSAALVRLLRIGGRDAEAAALLPDLLARHPEARSLRLLNAEVLASLGRFEEGLAAVDALLEADPGDEAAILLRFTLSVRTGDWDAAARSAETVFELAPCEPALYALWRREGDGPALLGSLLARCDAALARRPICAEARYWRAITLAARGRPHEAVAAMGLDEARVGTIAPPPAYPEIAPLNAALAEEIVRNPSLTPDPAGLATRGGRQTRQLRQPGARAVEALLGSIRSAVEAYAADRAAAVPAAVRLAAWAVVCGPSGRQASHRHPRGWLSGVYYVQAPPAAAMGAGAGRLLLGALEEDAGKDPPWDIRAIEPVPGRIVLFPSHVPHATEPTGCPEERISVAFDVIPCG